MSWLRIEVYKFHAFNLERNERELHKFLPFWVVYIVSYSIYTLLLYFFIKAFLYSSPSLKDFMSNIDSTSDIIGQISMFKFFNFKVKVISIEGILILTSYLGVAFAFLNLLPIPSTSGGRIIEFIHESISGRDMPSKQAMLLQKVGMLLLFISMVAILIIDVINFHKSIF